MSRIFFENDALEEYIYWQNQDRKTLKRINALLKDIQRNPYDGIGKPEILKHDLTGLWSRRIDDNNRILYEIINEDIRIVHCKTHYKDK